MTNLRILSMRNVDGRAWGRHLKGVVEWGREGRRGAGTGKVKLGLFGPRARQAWRNNICFHVLWTYQKASEKCKTQGDDNYFFYTLFPDPLPVMAVSMVSLLPIKQRFQIFCNSCRCTELMTHPPIFILLEDRRGISSFITIFSQRSVGGQQMCGLQESGEPGMRKWGRPLLLPPWGERSEAVPAGDWPREAKVGAGRAWDAPLLFPSLPPTPPVSDWFSELRVGHL